LAECQINRRFYRASSHASAVLSAIILSARPVCLAVRLSVTCMRVLCDKTKQCAQDIFIPHERAITLAFWHQQWLVGLGDAPFRLKFAFKVTHLFEKPRFRQVSSYNVSIVKDSERSSIMTNRKSTTGFSTSYRPRWSAQVTSKSPKGGLKAIFLFLKIKFNFHRTKSATKFLYIKPSSGKALVEPFLI